MLAINIIFYDVILAYEWIISYFRIAKCEINFFLSMTNIKIQN